jgi:hypothetical protein
MLNSDGTIDLTLPAEIRVLMPGGQVEEMKLETYLAGAVAAEIGTLAPLEALKAQAIASRTYAALLRRHPEQNADVCITAHCQRWKRVDPISAPEVFRALSETWGMVALHADNLINAFFFEHCDGHTRNAEDMLIPPFDYLRGVDCPCGFLTLKGHGVGMCKRGAIVMARRGASFEQILSHYYRGVAVARASVANPIVLEPEQVELTQPPAPPPQAPAKRKAKPKATAPRRKPAREPERVRRFVPPAPATAPEPAPPAPPIVIPVELPSPKAEPLTPEPTPAATEATAPTPAISPPSAPTVEIETAPSIAAQPAPAEPLAETPAVVAAPAVAAPRVAETKAPALEQAPRARVRPIHVDHLPGGRMIAGCLSRAGAVVSIEDARGNKTLVFSGSAPHYGEGGFETLLAEDGVYRVAIDGQLIEVNVRGETVFIHAG